MPDTSPTLKLVPARSLEASDPMPYRLVEAQARGYVAEFLELTRPEAALFTSALTWQARKDDFAGKAARLAIYLIGG